MLGISIIISRVLGVFVFIFVIKNCENVAKALAVFGCALADVLAHFMVVCKPLADMFNGFFDWLLKSEKTK